MEGMYKVLTNNIIRQRLVRNGLERVKMFSGEISAKKHINVFEEVLNQS